MKQIMNKEYEEWQRYSTASVYAKRNEAFHISLIEGEYLYIADGTGTYEAR